MFRCETKTVGTCTRQLSQHEHQLQRIQADKFCRSAVIDISTECWTSKVIEYYVSKTRRTQTPIEKLRVSIHIRYSLQMEMGIHEQHRHMLSVRRLMTSGLCGKFCQRCAKVTAANSQAMVFKLDNHCTRWMHCVVSNH